MKKLITLILICIGLGTQAQTNGGIIVVGGVAVNVPDTSTTKYVQALYNGGDTLSLTQKFAANFLVTNEKVTGLWSKSKAEYPILGGTATSHKWNIKDPRDLDAAFRLTYSGTITHDATGMKGDGLTGISDTHLNAFFNLTLNNTHLSVYINSTSLKESSDIGTNLGIDTNRINIHTKWSDGNAYYDFYNGLKTRIILTNNDGLGMYLSNRVSSNYFKAYKSGVNIGYNTNVESNTNLINSNIYLLNISAGIYSDKRIAYSDIGSGLTDTEALNKSIIVTSFESILGRK